ncbi:CD1375 family protein [Clostridium estertheticum]|nr:CD1375 family protein [Clostridium estertheticum]MBZ9615280.1 hypothetical protein [Clostridium estertheticum subsp. laramiense]WAG75169.1 hypothetical protein LL032_06890 [Clostridium estertheticum]
MVNMYYKLVKAGLRTMEVVEGKIQVLEKYRSDVQLLLDKDNITETI